MGTVFSFRFATPVDVDVCAAVDAELHRIDRVFSTWRADSDISRLRAGACSLDHCAPDVAVVLALCDDMCRLTRGWFSSTYSGSVDPTGLVKGWAVARVSAMLASAGSDGHVVNGGGDVLAAGRRAEATAWRIGIIDPRDRRALLDVVEGPVAVATSGNTERPGEIVDPFTARPARDVLSATVLGPDILVADALATAAVAGGARASDWLDEVDGYTGYVSLSSAAWSDCR